MLTYLDTILQQGLRNDVCNDPGLTVSLLHEAARAKLINIDNVSDYVAANNAQQQYSVPTDFPCLAPPFPLMWLESRAPIVNGRVVRACGASPVPSRWGVLMMTEERNGQWLVINHLFADWTPSPTFKGNVWLGTTELEVAKDGSVPSDYVTFFSYHNVPFPNTRTNARTAQAMLDANMLLLSPVFLAICFMHCNNVTVNPAPPLPPRFYKGVPMPKWPHRYHTINITQMTKAISSHMAGTGANWRNALHICRGHFKNFSNGRGLFGKFKGRYWWGAQVRGTDTAASVDADYKVSP